MGILSQERPNGLFEFTSVKDGRATVDGDRLMLAPSSATVSRMDPDDPGGDYTDRPAALEPSTYRWRVDGVTLVGRAPSAADGLDADIAAALASGPPEWQLALREQNAQADRADRLGGWANATVAVIALVAALTAVLQVRSVGRDGGRPISRSRSLSRIARRRRARLDPA